MKNEFCDMDQDEIHKLDIPDSLRGLLLSPFQHNDDGRWVSIPRETFKEFTDAATEYAKLLSANSERSRSTGVEEGK